MYFVFSFALLRDSHHKCAAGVSVSAWSVYGDSGTSVVRASPAASWPDGPEARRPGAAPRPTPPTSRSLHAAPVPGCVQLLTSPVDTHLFLYFYFALLPATLYDSALS